MKRLRRLAQTLAPTLKSGSDEEIVAALQRLKNECPWDDQEVHDFQVTWEEDNGLGIGNDYGNTCFDDLKETIRQHEETRNAFGVRVQSEEEGVVWYWSQY